MIANIWPVLISKCWNHRIWSNFDSESQRNLVCFLSETIQKKLRSFYPSINPPLNYKSITPPNKKLEKVASLPTLISESQSPDIPISPKMDENTLLVSNWYHVVVWYINFRIISTY
uniref:Uncharacterized protein n=1 Tax=Rhizophagus irregularis (strain DAOM 181602 / DAOM 197198 / MUCL 43194) TaxID=747089 RepID=U9SLC6_RHIID